jgi:4-hydroxyphenylpyruvate dioxygenase
MDRSIATVSLSGTLEDKLVAASAAGFDAIELFEPDLISCPLAPVELRARLADLGLKLSLYQPFRDFEGVGHDLLQQHLQRAERKFALMQELGAELILVCSTVHPHAVDDDRLAATQLRGLAQRAAEHNIRIAYEALAWGRHVNSYEHAWQIVRLADHPNLGVCLDSFHILARGDDPLAIRDIPGDKIFFVQLADAPRLGMDVLQWSRHHRCLPGQGEFDLASFMMHVLAVGYDGPLSLEVFNDILRQADPAGTAIDAMRALRVLEDALARREPPASRSDGLRLRAVPPAPELDGYTFVEVGVDLVSEPVVEGMLTALGFRQAGLHRSKPVELWRNGRTSVVLNRDQRPASDHAPGDAKVTTIAVDTRDPNRLLQRAESLLAPRLDRRRGPREAELPAIAAPDGLWVFVCGPETADRRRWLDDFIAPDVTPAAVLSLSEIDHITLSQPLESFDETRLFYRAVLGLEPQTGHELPAPDGLVRSQALASRTGRVRIVLNVPALGRRSCPAVQHIAFGCQDIFGAAETLHAEGVPVLPITDNYYDDLGSRLDLADDLLVRMRDLGICYDRLGDGEFLHLYCPLMGPRLFFEVVERRGAYDGYGAANSVVRMAAQRSSLEALAMA